MKEEKSLKEIIEIGLKNICKKLEDIGEKIETLDRGSLSYLEELSEIKTILEDEENE